MRGVVKKMTSGHLEFSAESCIFLVLYVRNLCFQYCSVIVPIAPVFPTHSRALTFSCPRKWLRPFMAFHWIYFIALAQEPLLEGKRNVSFVRELDACGKTWEHSRVFSCPAGSAFSSAAERPSAVVLVNVSFLLHWSESQHVRNQKMYTLQNILKLQGCYT